MNLVKEQLAAQFAREAYAKSQRMGLTSVIFTMVGNNMISHGDDRMARMIDDALRNLRDHRTAKVKNQIIT